MSAAEKYDVLVLGSGTAGKLMASPMRGPGPFTMSGLCREEPLDQNCCVLSILFGEKVATLHRLSLRGWGPLPPNAERTAVFCIESVERATLGP